MVWAFPFSISKNQELDALKNSLTAKTTLEIIENVYEYNQLYFIDAIEAFKKASYVEVAGGILKNMDKLNLAVQLEV